MSHQISASSPFFSIEKRVDRVYNLANSVDDVIGTIVKKGNKVEYTNPAGKVLKWTEQSNIDKAIIDAKKIDDVGKINEVKVAEFVKKHKELEAFGMKVKPSAGDIDVSTIDEIIEVKSSFSAWSGKKNQLTKFVDKSDELFLNPHNKKVILYIDEPLTSRQIEIIKSKIPDNVTLVNSLSELKTVLK